MGPLCDQHFTRPPWEYNSEQDKHCPCSFVSSLISSLSFLSVRSTTNLLRYTSPSTFLKRYMFCFVLFLSLSPIAIIRRGFTLEILRYYKFKRKNWLKLLSVMKLFLTFSLSLLQAIEQCLTPTHWTPPGELFKNIDASTLPQRFSFNMLEMTTNKTLRWIWYVAGLENYCIRVSLTITLLIALCAFNHPSSLKP